MRVLATRQREKSPLSLHGQGVPFVRLAVAALVIGEVLRRLHSGTALELVAGSLMSLEDVEVSATVAGPYEHGFTTVSLTTNV